jgi:drug/metabolite transporter (DMT)-like permease
MDAPPSSRTRERALAVGLLCATVVIWGLSFVSTKAALAAFPPMTLAVVRFAIAALVLYPIRRRLAPHDRLARADLPKVAVAGLLGVSIYFLFENYGIKLTTASESALIVASIPTLTLAVEAIRTRGETHASQWLGSALSFAGVGLIVVNGLQLSGSAAGYACMIGADFSWVAYTLLTRDLAARYSQVALVFWQGLAGLCGLLPLLLFDVGRMGKPTLMILVHVGFLATACSALGYWFYAHALRVLGAAATSVYINVIPVVAVAVGVSLGEKLGALQFGGGAMVVVGVLVATRRRTE